MDIEEVAISKVKSNKDNPRIIKDDKFKKLVESINSFPQMLKIRPIVVNDDMIVLGGNMRLKACKEAGLKRVHIIKASGLTEKQQEEFIVKDNVGFGEWDWEMLGNDWDMEELEEWGLDVPDFTVDEPEAEETEEPSETPEDPETVIGDVWELGEHRLLCGDSTNTSDVEKLMDGKDADVIVFDPPYELENLYTEAMPIPKDNQKLLVMWDFKRFALAPAKAMEAGWEPQYEFIWDNVQSWYTPNRPLQKHKSIGVFGNDPYFDTENSVIMDGKKREAKKVKNTRGECDYVPIDGGKHIATVEAFPNTQQNDDHGHGKPVVWVSAIFGGVGGSLYLDLFGGSGASLVSCMIKNKTCYTMELDPRYCDVIVNRYVKFCVENGRAWSLKLNGEEYTGKIKWQKNN